jgi:hypothetical protein
MKEIIYEGIKFIQPNYIYDPKKQNKCQSETRKLIDKGILKRKPCEICGKNAFVHHENYNDIYNVRWLCQSHHVKLHNLFKKLDPYLDHRFN